MNERIKLLAEQAEEYIELPMPDEVYHMGDDVFRRHKSFNREKFAELLFNEIANTAVVSDGMFNGDERRLYVELRLGDMVKKISVFGVEDGNV